MAYIYDLTDTWSAGGTAFNAIKMNVTDSASAAGSKLITLQTNGAEHFSVSKAGVGYFSGNVGIGTGSPATRLSVAGTVTVTDGTIDMSTGYSIRWGGAASGIYAGSGTQDMVFTVGSSERMRVNGSSGNVGIGTSTPGVRLDVSTTSAGGTAEVLRLSNPGGGANTQAQMSFSTTFTTYGTITGGYGAAAPQMTFNLPSATAGNYIWQISGTERMRLSSAGNLGLGVSPTAVSNYSVLAIKGRAAGQSALINFFDGADTPTGSLQSDTNYGFLAGTSGARPFAVFTNGSERMTVTGVGNVGIGTGSPANRLVISNAGTNGFEFNTTDNVFQTYNRSTGAYVDFSAYSLNHRIFTGSSPTERMRVDSAGNVGIGTSSPTTKLEVSGTGEQTFRITSVIDGSVATPRGSFISYRSGSAQVETARISSFNRFANLFGGNLEFSVLNSSNVMQTSMVIDRDGNLGVGTSSPSQRLVVAGSQINNVADDAYGIALNATTGNVRVLPYASAYSGSALIAYNTGYAGLGPFSIDASRTQFYTNSQERVRIDSSGNVGIGTSSPAARLEVASTDAITSLRVDTENAGVSANNYSQVALADNNAVRTWWRNVRDGTGKTAFGYNDHLAFLSDAGATPIERVRITSAGNFLVGKTSATITDQGAEIRANGQINSALPTGNDFWNSYSTSAAAYRFYVSNGGTIFATSTSISAISDQRLKENVRDLDAGLDAILALKPRRFDWKAGKGKDVRDDMGFIAQEVEEVLPELIGDWKSGEGDPEDLKSVKAGDLIPVLVKAIQELTARVAQLEGN